jgi:hypothetical protein
MDFDFDMFEQMEEENEHKNLMISQLLLTSSSSGLSKEQLDELKAAKENMYGLKDSVIFLVDCQAFHFNNENIERSNLELVKDAYLGLMRRKVVFHSSDRTGMVLYNCGLTKNEFDTKGVYVLDELDNVSADKIKKAQSMETDLNNLKANSTHEKNLLEVSGCF